MRTWIGKFSLLAFIGLLTLSVPAWAAPSLAPDALVNELSHKWQNEVNGDAAAIKKNRDLLFQVTDDITGPYIDYDKIARLVLGQYWRQASDTQRKEFVKEFRKYLVHTYATAMYEYRNADIEVKPTKVKPGDDMTRVQTVVKNPGQPPVSLNFVLFKKDGDWQAMDVLIENVSVVATLRSIYRSEIQQKGLDQVIADIAAKAKG